MGTQAGTRRRARGVRHRGPEDPLQAEPCGASGSRRPAPLLPCGTGNYNPKTARIYTDLGLLTCDPVVGQDMTRLFNQLSGYAPKSSFHRLLVAPRTVRSGLIQRIRREEDAARAGKEAWIKIKVNSIVDEKTIDALYRASQAGVKIDIVERGICALKPGVPGLSENIRVRSILGRFLEHSRIYAFANSDGPQIGEGPAAGPEVWIGSADLMHRNLDRRVEALVRITAPEQIDELIKYVDLQMADSTTSWHMAADGTYVRHAKDEEVARWSIPRNISSRSIRADRQGTKP